MQRLPHKLLREFRQLSCLGLDSRELLPHLVESLEPLLPTMLTTFQWTSAQGDTLDWYLKGVAFPLETQQLWWNRYYNRTEGDVGPITREFLREPQQVVNYSKSYGEKFYRSPMYEEVHGALGIHHLTRASVKDGHRCLGMFTFSREKGAPDFNAAEWELMTRVLPMMAHAISCAAAGKAEEYLADYQGGSYVCSGSLAGQDITGWHWASGDEVLAMFSSVHPDSTTGLDPWYSSWGDSLILTGLAPTYHHLYYLDVWSGWTNEMPVWRQGQATLWHNAGFMNQDSWDYTGYFTTSSGHTSPHIGAWLWRPASQDSPPPCGALAPCAPADIPADDPIECGAAFPCPSVSVPEPGPMFLLAVGLMGAIARSASGLKGRRRGSDMGPA